MDGDAQPGCVAVVVLIPVRDLFGVAVWAAGLFGNSVMWRGQKLHAR